MHTKNLHNKSNYFLSNILSKRGFNDVYIKIIEHWKEVIPEKYYNCSFPSKILWGNDNKGILYIVLNNSSMKAMMIHDSTKILKNIHTLLLDNKIYKIYINMNE